MYTIWVADDAREDIKEIYAFGYQTWGEAIADAYHALIQQGFEDIIHNPVRPGSRRVSGRQDNLVVYSLRFANARAGQRIKQPRHHILYYILEEEQTLLIARVLRSSRQRALDDISRSDVLTAYRDASEEES